MISQYSSHKWMTSSGYNSVEVMTRISQSVSDGTFPWNRRLTSKIGFWNDQFQRFGPRCFMLNGTQSDKREMELCYANCDTTKGPSTRRGADPLLFQTPSTPKWNGACRFSAVWINFLQIIEKCSIVILHPTIFFRNKPKINIHEFFFSKWAWHNKPRETQISADAALFVNSVRAHHTYEQKFKFDQKPL